MDPPSVPSWFRHVRDRLAEQLLTRRRAYGLACLIVIVVLLLTQGAITVPFTVGWDAASTLVRYETELEHLQRDTAECAAAAPFFRTPEGKRFARKLMYNQLEDGERRVAPDLPRVEGEPGVSRRIGDWFHAQKDAITDGARFKLAVLKRWISDPPRPPEAPPPTEAPEEHLPSE